MMTTLPAKPDITLTSPSDLIGVVPYLLGFHPSDSLVMVGLSGGNVALSARVDLPPPGTPANVVPLTPGTLRRNGVQSVALVGYGEPGRITPCLDHMRAMLTDDGIEIVDALRVTDGRWWSYLCADPDCCPADGTPVDTESSAAAACVAAGQQALPDRAALARQLQPAERSQRDAVGEAIAAQLYREACEPYDPDGIRARRLSLLRAVIAADELPDTDDIAALGAALTEPRVRDEAIAAIDDGTHRVELWIWLTRHLPDGYVAAPATLTAYAAYRTGNGALANEALDRALADQPDYELAALLRQAVNSGMPPHALPPLTRSEIARSYGEVPDDAEQPAPR